MILEYNKSKKKILTVLLACITVHVGRTVFVYCENLDVHSVLLQKSLLYKCYAAAWSRMR